MNYQTSFQADTQFNELPIHANQVEKKTVVLIDNDRSRLEKIADSLENAGYEVSILTTAQTVLREIRRIKPSLAVVGLRMTGIDGLEVLQSIQKLGSIATIMLVEPDDSFGEMTALKLGADDVVSRSAASATFLVRVRAVLRRGPANFSENNLGEETITLGPLTIDPGRHQVHWDRQPLRLTRSEFIVLHSLARRPGFVHTRDQIIAKIYGDGTHAVDRIVDCHMKRLRKKLKKLDKNNEAIETLYGVGYRLNIQTAPTV